MQTAHRSDECYALCAECQAPQALPCPAGEVCSLHCRFEDRQVKRARCIAGLKTGVSSVLVTGADFYSNPRPSPDGTKLAWVRSCPRAHELLHAVQPAQLRLFGVSFAGVVSTCLQPGLLLGHASELQKEARAGR